MWILVFSFKPKLDNKSTSKIIEYRDYEIVMPCRKESVFILLASKIQLSVYSTGVNNVCLAPLIGQHKNKWSNLIGFHKIPC